jgi:hypothetical protein
MRNDALIVTETPIVRVLSVCAAILLALASPCSAADRYVGAMVDETGQLRIFTSDGRAIVLPKKPEQVGFDRIAISQDGGTVGWVALYPNCCTSYPIPLELVVYSGGEPRTFTGSGLPVWQWHFTAGGKQVAFEQETVHGGLGIHYELRDVASGRLISEYSPPVGPDSQPLANQTVPKWVAELNAKQ